MATLMTLKEAAEILGLKPDTLRLQIRNGRMRGRKRGRDLFVTRTEVDRYQRESLGRPGRPRKPDALLG
jgi:excisionase family DNA binding protein